jgi:FKBP-type peptidyl-prolyl cis-trans isomerase
MGVTGGVPEGFDVGQPTGAPGSIWIKGIDLGVRGMHVGGLRRLIVPPSLAFGNRQAGELPPNSTIEVDVELLSIKPKTVF